MKFHGILGLILIIFTQLNFYFQIEPFASWYFPIIWTGYILFIDALVHKFKGSSLLTKHPKRFIFMFILSIIVWQTFELINKAVLNWDYHGTDLHSSLALFIFKNLSFATVIPAIFETADLILTLHWFDHQHLKKKHNISKALLFIMFSLGLISLILPLLLPTVFFPLVWLSFFFFLDPLNYLHKQPSIIGHLKDKQLRIPLAFAIGSLICGFFWEFWNYWAVIKWTYAIPYVGFLKIFEMPLLGYLGYLPFGLEAYAVTVYIIYVIRKEFKQKI